MRLIRPGVAFLDRDGTINVKAPEGSYIEQPDQVTLLAGAARAIRKLNDAHLPALVVTNQRGIALGRMSEQDLDAVHRQMARLLRAEAGAHIDAIFYCPHAEGTCDCRKPRPGLFHQALECWPWVDFRLSVMIGDSDSDVKAAQAVGAKPLRIGVDVHDLYHAVEQLTGEASMAEPAPLGPSVARQAPLGEAVRHHRLRA